MSGLQVLVVTRLRQRPVGPLLRLPLVLWRPALVLGSAGLCSNVFHRVALMAIPVSFVHTVKASQPLFSGPDYPFNQMHSSGPLHCRSRSALAAQHCCPSYCEGDAKDHHNKGSEGGRREGVPEQ